MTDTYAPAPFEVPAEDKAPMDKRTKLMAGGLAAAVLAGGAYFFLLSGGGEEDESFIPVKPRKTTTQTGGATSPAVPAVSIPRRTEVVAGRNPYAALYVEPKQAAAPAAPSVPLTPITVPGVPVTGGSGTPSGPTAPVVERHTLVLKGVSGSKGLVGTFTVDGKRYDAKVSDVFGPKSEILVRGFSQASDGTWIATLLVGDGAPFDARQGQKLSVL